MKGLPGLAAAVAVVAGVLAASASVSGTSVRTDFFKTPSGNIGCAYSAAFQNIPQYLRCDIRSGLHPRPARPKNCDLEFGDSIGMSATGRPALGCHGDTVFDAREPVLAYGRTWRRGAFTCTSRSAGLRCTNRAGHGFFLSRERWYRF